MVNFGVASLGSNLSSTIASCVKYMSLEFAQNMIVEPVSE